MLELLLKFDQKLLLWLNGFGGKSAALDFVMITLSSSELWFTVGIFFFFVSLHSGRLTVLSTFLLALFALGLADLISFEVVKPFVGRERPCWTVDGVYKVLGSCGGSYGFTSNHAANAGAFIAILALSRYFSAKVLLLVVFFGLLIGISRVYLGVHYPLDVIGGYFLGSLVALGLWTIKIQVLTTAGARLLIRGWQACFNAFRKPQ